MEYWAVYGGFQGKEECHLNQRFCKEAHQSNSSGLVPACFDWLQQCAYDVPCRQEESSVYHYKKISEILPLHSGIIVVLSNK